MDVWKYEHPPLRTLLSPTPSPPPLPHTQSLTSQQISHITVFAFHKVQWRLTIAIFLRGISTMLNNAN